MCGAVPWYAFQVPKGSLPMGRVSGFRAKAIPAILFRFEIQMGVSAHFLFVKPIPGNLGWLEPTLASLGYELVDLEMSRSGLVRVFIDKPAGVTVDDCATVSHHLMRVFAVEGFDYERLEVSSPGLDRPVKRLEDFGRFAGREVSVRLKLPREGRRRLEGRLAGVQDEMVLIDVEGKRWSIAMSDIDRARLVPDV